MIIPREQAIAWLKPMLDDLGINNGAVMSAAFEPDEICITCVVSSEPGAPFPPGVALADQPGAEEHTMLLYRVVLQIVDVEPAKP